MAAPLSALTLVVDRYPFTRGVPTIHGHMAIYGYDACSYGHIWV